MCSIVEKSTRLTQTIWTELAPKIKYVLTDCDGVIWHSKERVPGASIVLEKLRDRGIQLGFVTNNSGTSRAELLEKFSALKIKANPEEIFCVNNLTAKYLVGKGVTGKLYMIGHKALYDELQAVGLSCNEPGPDPVDDYYQSWSGLHLEETVQAVVVGFDNHFSLAKVCRAASYLEDPKCLFVATDADSRIAAPKCPHLVLPCTGSIIAAVQAPTGRTPELIGKPSTLLADMIRTVYPGLSGQNTLVIGDNLETDIEFGRRSGFTTLLVETGVHKRHHVRRSEAPSFYTPSIADLAEFMR
ncbi:glycerol-3-phosphate phosphatase [Galendromus occidentalis]|uniref:Glycerol-3-phosphate phosphatase n=1 Tax=Galendromus occidentalis TaxID=34638 RepID=A0AAJ6QXT8_9ACAR|nr:glycerol-3-phosphate phosphatase [Galendromus occidentalis]